MIRPLSLVASVTLALACVLPCAAADPASYDDDGMHYAAPADFEKVPLPPGNPLGSDDSDSPTPIALFVYHKDRSDRQTITIAVARFEGDVAEFDTQHISDERKEDGVFISTNTKTTLANGMPAYFTKVTSGSTAGQFLQRYEMLVCDGTRSIIVAYGGPQGSFGDATAKAAFASLYVVVYPHRRK
jgi:hypothetical protein